MDRVTIYAKDGFSTLTTFEFEHLSYDGLMEVAHYAQERGCGAWFLETITHEHDKLLPAGGDGVHDRLVRSRF